MEPYFLTTFPVLFHLRELLVIILVHRPYLLNGVEHGQPEVLRAALARPDPADHVGAVLDGLLGVEGALLAREPLADDARLLVDLHVDVGRVVRGHGPRGQGWMGLTDKDLMKI